MDSIPKATATREMHLGGPVPSHFCLAVLILLIGCDPFEPVSTKDSDSATGDTIKVIRPDTGIPTDTSGVNKRGPWDDFPAKYLSALKQLSAGIPRLPMPYGILYFTLTNDPLPKASADTACPDGPREIFGLDSGERGVYMADTIRYYDAAGEAGCRWNSPTIVRVVHNRYILDLASGQAWEEITDSVSNQLVVPRHSISGRGRIRLTSGLELRVESFGVEILTPFREPGARIMEAHLRLAWKDGYSFHLEMAATKPFKAADFLPIRDSSSARELMLSGPIRKDTLTVGYMDLFSDHTVAIRDWSGKRVEASR